MKGSGFRVQGSGFRVQGCGGGFAANIYGAMPEGLRVAGQKPATKNIWLPIQASLSSQNFSCHVSFLFEIAFCVKFVISLFESWPESVSSSNSKALQFGQKISSSFNDFPQIGQVVIIETPLLYIE